MFEIYGQAMQEERRLYEAAEEADA